MNDPTEATRRSMIAQALPGDLRALAFRHNDPIWNTEELLAEFEVLGFQAPYVAVKRKSDGVKGSLMFTHSPRFYFGWTPDRDYSDE